MAARIAILALACLVGSAARADSPVTGEALQEYVSRTDDSYRWVVRRQGRLGNGTYAELILTSQTWRDVVWKHQLFLVRPSSAPPDAHHALLFLGGGRWKPERELPARERERLPEKAELFAGLAEQLGTPVAVLLHVPQQPMFDGKTEDGIIAHTFDRFLATGDPDWPLLLPMVKSAVRAMDAAQQFARDQWELPLETFTVSGGSKRGWTTWLAGAVDPRVTALAPMVIDVLNMVPQMRHQQEAWGDLSEKIDVYTNLDLHRRLETERGRLLRAIVDPYSYRERLTQPKLVIIGTNDRYWPLDALNLYWDDLPEPKYVLYVPNNGHGLSDLPRLLGGMNALHRHAANGSSLPRMSWEFSQHEAGLRLAVGSDIAPTEVQAWIATSPTRDFRDAKWSSRPAGQEDGRFVYDLLAPAAGYAAMFGEAVFDGDGLPYYLSTNVRIVKAPAALRSAVSSPKIPTEPTAGH